MHSAYSGLSHGLSALWTPAPHVLVQWDQDDQTPHPPWIASGVLPTVMHSPEKHHWKENRRGKQLKIVIAGKCYCELFVISVPEGRKRGKVNGDVTGCPSFMLDNGRATHASSNALCRQCNLQAAWLTVTLFSPHRVPSAAASSLERQEPFTEHQSVWQRFWKRKKTAAVWSRAELLWPRFSKASHCFVHPFTKPYKGCISRDRCSGFSTS